QSCKNEATACDRCRLMGLLTDGEGDADGEEKDEDEDEDEEEDVGERREEDVGVGRALVEEHNRQGARELARFMQGLELLRGSCVICRFAGKVGKQQAEHRLDECRTVNKWRFLHAKKAAQEEGGKRRGGWLAKYGACYKCGNVQVVCQGQGRGECRYKDTTMPLSWVVQYQEGWKERVFNGLEERRRACEDKGRYMLWLAEEASVSSEQGSNM
ncbi:hypothetical protein LTS18_014520, partial [Coniosporium uncinatum]